MFEYVVREEDIGSRIDKVLADHLDTSRSQIQKWIEAGVVTVNGSPIQPRSKLGTGVTVVLNPPPPEPDEIFPEPMDLEVLFEDDDIIILNKAAGTIVHPGAGCRQGTLVSGLLHHCRGQLSGIGGVERPGIVHRLDKETSGVLAVAKNDFAHQRLAKSFQDRNVTKIYRAFVHGEMKDEVGSWRAPLGRHPVHRHKQSVRKSGGRDSRTDYECLETWPGYSLMECRLFTGRTHQIRVHASHAGFPLVGDQVYGGKRIKAAGVERHLLHAWKLSFFHPRSGESLAFEAELPEDFGRFKQWLSK
ncbi:MAG: RluA family pseudouridine synthase [Verrucomicrobiota bacterium]